MKNLRASFFLFACIFLSIISNVAVGQQVRKHEIGFGGGAGISFVRGFEESSGYRIPALSYAFGITYQYRFSERVSFCAELDYEHKGSAYKIPLTGENSDPDDAIVAHTNYNYLILPILARFSFGNQHNLFCNAGPYVGYLMKVHAIVEDEDSNNYFEEFDVTDQSYTYDFGISVGLGAKIPVNRKIAFKFEVRNNLGLVNISKTIDASMGVVKTNATNLLLGVTISL
jgi:hypothetical protein